MLFDNVIEKRLLYAIIMSEECAGGTGVMQLSEKIRVLREKFLLTQEDFAKELGVAPSTVNRWENGKARPNIAAMRNIKAFCEIRDYPYEEIENEWLSHK